MKKRVVITGYGAISPVGNTVPEMWDSIKKGTLGIGEIQSFDTSDCKVKIAAELKNFVAENYVEKKETKRLDKFSIYTLAAGQEAMETAGLLNGGVDSERFGVIVGSGIGGLATLEEQIIKMHEKGPARVSPLFIPMAISNMGAGNLAIKYNAKGVNISVVTACATGTNSIGEAFRYIQDGRIDVCLAGGSEAPVTKIGVAGFTSIQALTTCNDPAKASIPFDKDRSGFVMGEGAGIVVLEELEHALKRNANILGEIVGYGATCDAYHMTAPSPDGEGAARAIELAVAESGAAKEEIGYINAHGTSTEANDLMETLAIKKVFGDHAYRLAVSSTKSMVGHLLGAAGAIEAIICMKALQDGFLPPTIGLSQEDEKCDLDYVKGKGRNLSFEYALSNSFGFGGHNAVLCFKKWEGGK